MFVCPAWEPWGYHMTGYLFLSWECGKWGGTGYGKKSLHFVIVSLTMKVPTVHPGLCCGDMSTGEISKIDLTKMITGLSWSHCLLWDVYCYGKIPWPVANWGGVFVLFLFFHLTTCSLSFREARKGTQGRNLEARIEAEVMEQCCSLACSSWLAQPAFLWHPRATDQGPPTSVINQEIVP